MIDEVTLNAFAVRISPNNDDKDLRVKKKDLLFDLCSEVAKSDAKLMETVNFYPYRKHVEIDNDKLESHRLILNSEEFKRLNHFLKKFKNSVRKETLHNELGLADYFNYSRPVFDILYSLVRDNGVLTLFGESLTIDDCNQLVEYRKIEQTYKYFTRMVAQLNTDNYLPIFYKTDSYIKFKDGLALLSFRMDTSTNASVLLANRVLTQFLSKLNPSVEVVNYEQGKTFLLVNILCENMLVPSVLKEFEDLSIEAFGHRSSSSYFKQKDYNLDIEIEYNKGQTNESREWYFILYGDKYNDLKPEFSLTDKSFLGLSVYE